jgi:hypothetical protein
MNGEYIMIWKDVVIAYFKVVSKNSGETEETDEASVSTSIDPAILSITFTETCEVITLTTRSLFHFLSSLTHISRCYYWRHLLTH